MRILLFSDLHGHYDGIYSSVKHHEPVDLILLAGDITDFGPEEAIDELEDTFAGLEHIPVFTVLGNCDPSHTIKTRLEESPIQHIGKEVIEWKDFVFAGIDGGLKSFFHTVNEYSEEEYLSMINNIRNHPLWNRDGKKKIILSHVPPYRFRDKVLTGHIGSKSLNTMVGEADLIICGHAHEQKGQDHHEGTLIVNPGPYKQKSYALLTVSENMEFSVDFY